VISDSRESVAHTNIEKSDLNENMVLDLDRIDEILAHWMKHGDANDDHFNQLYALSKDVRYLYRMRELEDASKATSKLMDAVPVTGLILARLCTLENELKTVIELWEHRMASAIIEEDENEVPFGKGVGSDSDESEVLSKDGMKKCVSYKGPKVYNEDAVLKLLLQGGLLAKHGKKTWTTPIHLQVSQAKDRVLVRNPETQVLLKDIPLNGDVKILSGKNSHFHFYAVERHCFCIQFNEKSRLNLETRSELERDKWVAAFRWLLATTQK